MYSYIFNIGNIVFYIMLGVCFLLLLQKIVYHIVGLFPSQKFPEAKKDHKFVILIPARNESKVIEDLLISIKDQDYNPDLLKTYVIVESEKDPTCEIAKKYKNTEIFVRKRLDLKGKGYALDEAIQYIFEKKEKYDALFVFDADNVLTKNYIKEMNKTYDLGYEIALGYRNSKNWNGGWVASCSALTFSMVNTFHNKCRSRFNQNVILSGTGFYIDFKIIKKIGGWKFYALTEDYELSMFSTVNDLKSTYNEYAEFYDEQPTKLKVSWNQRMRWVKGYGQVDKKYKKQLLKGFLFDKENKISKLEYTMSILPVMSLIITAVGYSLFTLTMGIVGSIIGDPTRIGVYIAFAAATFSIYLFLALYGMFMLTAERKHINITFKNALVCCLMMPIYMGSYIPIYFSAVTKKEVEWVPIDHNVKMNVESGKQQIVEEVERQS